MRNSRPQRIRREPPLVHAAAIGAAAEVALLLRAGVDPDSDMANGSTPLAAAAEGGHGDVVEQLLAAGAAVGACSRGGNPPLTLAVVEGDAAIVARLMQAGADATAPFDEEGETIIEVASRWRHCREALARMLSCTALDHESARRVYEAVARASNEERDPRQSSLRLE